MKKNKENSLVKEQIWQMSSDCQSHLAVTGWHLGIMMLRKKWISKFAFFFESKADLFLWSILRRRGFLPLTRPPRSRTLLHEPGSLVPSKWPESNKKSILFFAFSSPTDLETQKSPWRERNWLSYEKSALTEWRKLLNKNALDRQKEREGKIYQGSMKPIKESRDRSDFEVSCWTLMCFCDKVFFSGSRATFGQRKYRGETKRKWFDWRPEKKADSRTRTLKAVRDPLKGFLDWALWSLGKR